MNYLTYKTINLVTGEEYIGCHVTKTLHDGHIGDGKALLENIKTYGRGVFKRIVLRMHRSESAMLKSKARLVNEAYVQRNDTLNVTIGAQRARHGHKIRKYTNRELIEAIQHSTCLCETYRNMGSQSRWVEMDRRIRRLMQDRSLSFGEVI